MKREVYPAHFNIEIVLQLFNTPGTEVAPWSNVIAEDFQCDRLSHPPPLNRDVSCPAILSPRLAHRTRDSAVEVSVQEAPRSPTSFVQAPARDQVRHPPVGVWIEERDEALPGREVAVADRAQ